MILLFILIKISIILQNTYLLIDENTDEINKSNI